MLPGRCTRFDASRTRRLWACSLRSTRWWTGYPCTPCDENWWRRKPRPPASRCGPCRCRGRVPMRITSGGWATSFAEPVTRGSRTWPLATCTSRTCGITGFAKWRGRASSRSFPCGLLGIGRLALQARCSPPAFAPSSPASIPSKFRRSS